MTTRRETTFIYVLIDPRTDEIRYVGKTDDPRMRLSAHSAPSQLQEDWPKERWIRSLKTEGLKPRMILIEEVDVACWEERERYWIRALHRAGCSLTNRSPGGTGRSGISPRASSFWCYSRYVPKQERFEEGMVRGGNLNRVTVHDPLRILVEGEVVEAIQCVLFDVLGELKQRDLEILRARLKPRKRKTAKEVGREWGCSDARVLQIIDEITAAIRGRLLSRGLLGGENPDFSKIFLFHESLR